MAQTLAPFAALIQRGNAAVMQALPNAVARVGGGEPFGVVFGNAYGSAFAGDVDATDPVCTAPADKVGDLQRLSAISIDGKDYAVQSAEPDGDGFVVLRLISEVG